jgi:hypothetical protein
MAEAAAPNGNDTGNVNEKVVHQTDQQQQGVLAWAHLAKASDSPDPTWQAMPPFVRDNFVTFVFSDHVLDKIIPARAEGLAGSNNQNNRQGQAEYVTCGQQQSPHGFTQVNALTSPAAVQQHARSSNAQLYLDRGAVFTLPAATQAAAAAAGNARPSSGTCVGGAAELAVGLAANGTGPGANPSGPPAAALPAGSITAQSLRGPGTGSKPQPCVGVEMEHDAVTVVNCVGSDAGKRNSKASEHCQAKPTAGRKSTAAASSKKAATSRRRSSNKAAASGQRCGGSTGTALNMDSIEVDHAPSSALAALAAAAVTHTCLSPARQQGQNGLMLLCETAAMHSTGPAAASPVLAAEDDHYHEQQDDDAANVMLAHAEDNVNCHGW